MRLLAILFTLLVSLQIQAQCTSCGGCSSIPKKEKAQIQQTMEIPVIKPIENNQTEVQEVKRKLRYIPGVIHEKRTNVKNKESWNAPSDPYYVVESQHAKGMSKYYTLIPSDKVTTEMIKEYTGKVAAIRGYMIEGKEYTPQRPIEQYPIESSLKLDPETGKMIKITKPEKRGGGFVVEEIGDVK